MITLYQLVYNGTDPTIIELTKYLKEDRKSIEDTIIKLGFAIGDENLFVRPEYDRVDCCTIRELFYETADQYYYLPIYDNGWIA